MINNSYISSINSSCILPSAGNVYCIL